MAAGLGFKTFTTGEVLTAADVNGYLMQGVLVFASEAARDAAITSPQEGQFAFTKDNNSLWYYDSVAWVASGATGDIEGVTAGTGISGGGTSGTVTITNSMATEIDAKGDLIVGTGADAFSRLAVGTNGQVLTADSGEATGLKFATPTASGFVGCQLTNAANISASNNTATALTFDTEIFDTDAFHSTASNTSRITIPAGKGGKYLFNLKVTWQGNATGIRFTEFFVNGTDRYRVMTIQATTSGNPDVTAYNCSFILDLVATDYLEARCQQSSGGSLNLVGNTEGGTLERFTLTAQFLGA